MRKRSFLRMTVGESPDVSAYPTAQGFDGVGPMAEKLDLAHLHLQKRRKEGAGGSSPRNPEAWLRDWG